jgi:sugar lactone lactonase YvrE
MPEGIAWDPVSRRTFVGSFGQRKILAVDQNCQASDFVPAGPGGLLNVTGIKVDSERRLLWACSVGEDPAPAGQQGPTRSRGTVSAFDLEGGRRTRHYELEGGEQGILLNDLALGSNGEVFVTESNAGAVYRLGPESTELELLLRSERVPLANGIALSADQQRLFVAHAGGVAIVDPKTAALSRVEAAEGISLVAADGLYTTPDGLILVQNQPFLDRVVQFFFDDSGARVVQYRVLSALHPKPMFHSTGYVRDGYFYFNGVPGGVGGAPAAEPPLLLRAKLAAAES